MQKNPKFSKFQLIFHNVPIPALSQNYKNVKSLLVEFFFK